MRRNLRFWRSSCSGWDYWEPLALGLYLPHLCFSLCGFFGFVGGFFACLFWFFPFLPPELQTISIWDVLVYFFCCTAVFTLYLAQLWHQHFSILIDHLDQQRECKSKEKRKEHTEYEGFDVLRCSTNLTQRWTSPVEKWRPLEKEWVLHFHSQKGHQTFAAIFLHLLDVK